jgi:glycosyltransferase involved in cell wall biosynthesis
MQLLTSDAFAGIERHVLQLSRELGKLGCASEIACPLSARRLRAEADASDIAVHPANGRSRVWIAAVARDIAVDPPQVLHVHDGRSALAGTLVSRKTRVVVRTQHFVSPASVERGRVLRAASISMHRSLNRRLDGSIAVSDAAAHAARERGEATTTRVMVIPPGIEAPSDDAVARARATRARAADPVVAFVGRLEAEKSLDTLIRAIPRVLARLPGCRFEIAGTGDAEPALKSLARRLGVDPAITWPGWVEPDQVFERAHVYVNPWPAEAFGMAMAEAMAFGLPVIAVDSAANPEMVQDGVNGILVTSRDPGAMADAIVRLASDLESAQRMGEAARERAVRLYRAERTAAATLSFYRRLLEKPGR